MILCIRRESPVFRVDHVLARAVHHAEAVPVEYDDAFLHGGIDPPQIGGSDETPRFVEIAPLHLHRAGGAVIPVVVPPGTPQRPADAPAPGMMVIAAPADADPDGDGGAPRDGCGFALQIFREAVIEGIDAVIVRVESDGAVRPGVSLAVPGDHAGQPFAERGHHIGKDRLRCDLPVLLTKPHSLSSDCTAVRCSAKTGWTSR